MSWEDTGNLYYIKLETRIGTFYKIGFTQKSSIHERFPDLEETENTKITDVLLFRKLPDAYQVERDLHDIFQNERFIDPFSSSAKYPLYKNGQSELYRRDVLNLDNKAEETPTEPIKVQTSKRISKVKDISAGTSDTMMIALLGIMLAVSYPILGIPLMIYLIYLKAQDLKDKSIVRQGTHNKEQLSDDDKLYIENLKNRLELI